MRWTARGGLIVVLIGLGTGWTALVINGWHDHSTTLRDGVHAAATVTAERNIQPGTNKGGYQVEVSFEPSAGAPTTRWLFSGRRHYLGDRIEIVYSRDLSDVLIAGGANTSVVGYVFAILIGWIIVAALIFVVARSPFVRIPDTDDR